MDSKEKDLIAEMSRIFRGDTKEFLVWLLENHGSILNEFLGEIDTQYKELMIPAGTLVLVKGRDTQGYLLFLDVIDYNDGDEDGPYHTKRSDYHWYARYEIEPVVVTRSRPASGGGICFKLNDNITAEDLPKFFKKEK